MNNKDLLPIAKIYGHEKLKLAIAQGGYINCNANSLLRVLIDSEIILELRIKIPGETIKEKYAVLALKYNVEYSHVKRLNKQMVKGRWNFLP